MLNSKKLFILAFFVIFAIASVLRLYRLSDFPVGFHIDEASLGYNAYSLLLTGKDDNGNRLPLYIDIFGDNRPSGYHYLAIIPVKFFGLSEFSTRLPGAFFGIISIFAIYLLSNAVFKNRIVALLSAFLLAISPWHVVLSRASAETIVSLFFILLGFALILISRERKSFNFLLLGSLSLMASFFFYHTPRVFVPLLLVSFAIVSSGLYTNKKYFKKFLLSVFLVGLISFLLVFVVKGGAGRFSQVNIFGHPETKLVMEEEIREDGVSGFSPYVTRISHNKVTSYSRTFVSNYLEYFNPNFLFINGGLPIWYKVPNLGLLYIIELPFILIGLFFLLTKRENFYRLLLLWIIIAPITAALTTDDVPSIQRAIVLFPILEIAAAFGIYVFLKGQKNFRRYIVFAISVAFIFNLYYFTHQYFVHSKVHRPWYRNNGFSEMLATVKKSYDSYDSVVVTKAMGGAYPLVLFHMQYDPIKYQQEGSPKDRDYKGFGKFVFVPQDCPSVNRDGRFPKAKKTIFVDRGDCPPFKKEQIFKKSQMIFREDRTSAFRIVYDEIL